MAGTVVPEAPEGLPLEPEHLRADLGVVDLVVERLAERGHSLLGGGVDDAPGPDAVGQAADVLAELAGLPDRMRVPVVAVEAVDLAPHLADARRARPAPDEDVGLLL